MTNTESFIEDSVIKENEKTFSTRSIDGNEERKRDDGDISQQFPVFSNQDSTPKRQKLDTTNNGFVMPSTTFNEPNGASEVEDIDNLEHQSVNNTTISDTGDTKNSVECKVPEKKNSSKPFNTLLKNMSKEGEEIYKQYIQIFSEVEQYESISVTRLEKLLEDAKNVERNLLQQREKLRRGVHQLSQTFRLP